MTGVFTTFISCFINSYPNKKLINYAYLEQMRDIFPSLILALVMCGIVLQIEKIGMGIWATLLVQIIVGVAIYVALSAIFRLEPFKIILDMLRKITRKKRNVR